MLYKILYGAFVCYFGYVSFTGRSVWNSSAERKMTPKGKRSYYNHK
jgi:hypothetical protein